MVCTRTKRAFTLVELLVVVLIVGVLASIAMSNFIGAQSKSKTAAIKGIMHTVQVAAEAYSVDSGGRYGGSIVQIVNYAPGGSNTLTEGSPGSWPPNPVDVSMPSVGSGAQFANAAEVVAARSTIGSGTPGQAEYCGTNDLSSYAVRGYEADGRQVLDSDGHRALVLSNQ